ncbi:fungal-specific transcription factor domain-containing protein [Ilyonectria sp. MPI-CAGE-AT-0026]|nr:fungal-specific transcription factor domain-containing protein [Ilyonectria sp. MPI-CAGE-AT-0026]
MPNRNLAFKEMLPMQPPGRKPRACVPCHERKVRCDFGAVGTPCSRCVSKDRTGLCVPVYRPEKSDSNKRKRVCNHTGNKDSREDSIVEDAADPQGDNAPLASPNTAVRTPVSVASRHNSISATRPPRSQSQFNNASPIPSAPTPRSSVQEAPVLADPYGLTAGHPQYSMSEDDAHLQTLYRMSETETVVLTPPSAGTKEEQHRRIVEYYSDFNALSVLNDAIGQPNRRRLVQVDLPGPQAGSVKWRELSRLDDIDRAYLAQRRVHELPSKAHCDCLLRLFSKHVYPYTPVVDRVNLALDYEQGNCSTFLLYAIFAITVPYAMGELVHAMGFKTVTEVQKECCTRARLLYDFGCEKNQLNLLQGCIFMSSFQNSFAPDKDFRFWFSNATHIATLMGLHRQDIERDLDPAIHRVCRRIWWLLFQRDVMFSLAGFENVRLLNDEEADALPLCADDWTEATENEAVQEILHPISAIQVKFVIENCKLTQLGARCLRLLRTAEKISSMDQIQDVGEAIASWRRNLPPELRMEEVSDWDGSNVWIIVILTFSFRLECLFYRTLRRRAKGLSPADMARVNQRLQGAMFELSTLLRRAMTYDVLQAGPPSMYVFT